jgi:hypothetical protein
VKWLRLLTQIRLVLDQPLHEPRDVFFQINLRRLAELFFRQRNIQGIAQPVRRDFGGIGMLADFKI